MTEEKGDTAIFTFGRFNPPTVGHEKLVVAVAMLPEEKVENILFIQVILKILKRTP